MRLELGAPVIGVQLSSGIGNDLYHLPVADPAVDADAAATICGLEGLVYAYGGAIRRRRMCSVCRAAAQSSGRAAA